MFKPRMTTLTGMIIMAALSRLIPHPPNFTPITAMALFGGAHFTRKGTAFAIPLAAMLLSDVFLGFHRLLPVVYGCFALTVCLGMWYRKRQGIASLTYATLTSSVLFFVVTNLAVWAFTPLYPKTFPGLVACFIAAIPFFGNALMGNAIYAAILFGTFVMAVKLIPALGQPDAGRSGQRPHLATIGIVTMMLSLFHPAAQATTAQSDAVFISLTRVAEPKNELPTNISVITSDQIEKSGAQNVNEAIERTTGMQILPYGTLGSLAALKIRGFTSSQILVMVDERPAGGGIALGQVDLSQIPVDNIERIEIVRGGASVNYGANAMGGVVNIITKRAKEDNPVTDITTEVRGFNTRIYRLNFGRKKSLPGGAAFETFVTGSRNLSNGFRDNSRYDSDAITAQLGYQNTNLGKISVELQNVDSSLGVPGTVPGNLLPDKFNDNAERRASSPNAKQDAKNFAARIEHEATDNAGETKVKAHFSTRDVTYKDPDFLYKSQNVNSSVGLEALRTLGEKWVLGIAYNRDSLDWRDISSFVANAGNWAIFGENKTRLANFAGEFKIISGLRFDRQTQFGGTFNPRVSAIYQHGIGGWKLSMNAGRSYRVPDLFDLFANDPFVNNNPNLKPEVAYTYDAGISKSLGRNYNIATTLFRANLKDIIQRDPATFRDPLNLGRGHKQGVEVELNGIIANNLRHNANYTYLVNKAQTDVRDTTGSTKYKTLPYCPKHMFNYSIETKVPLDIKVGTDFKYVHRRFSGNGETGQRLASYTLWDLKVFRQVLGSNVFLGVHNLLNKRYVDQAGYPQPGRYFSAGITIRFMD